MKEFVDKNLKFDENGRKFPKRVENTGGGGGGGGEGHIAHYEQCLLFPECFLKTCTADM